MGGTLGLSCNLYRTGTNAIPGAPKRVNAMQPLGHLIRQAVLLPSFRSSKSYWERRYRLGGTSGEGSSGQLAEFKAEVLNRFVRDHDIARVIEYGCGDGQQLALADYPLYLGLDVSRTCIEHCQVSFKDDRSKSFLWYEPATAVRLDNFIKGDLVLSLDVIYHLVEDAVYERYLDDLFAAAGRFVIIYSSDKDEPQRLPHVRHRRFTHHVAQRFADFSLVDHIENRHQHKSPCSFFVFARA